MGGNDHMVAAFKTTLKTMQQLSSVCCIYCIKAEVVFWQKYRKKSFLTYCLINTVVRKAKIYISLLQREREEIGICEGTRLLETLFNEMLREQRLISTYRKKYSQVNKHNSKKTYFANKYEVKRFYSEHVVYKSQVFQIALFAS